MFFSIILTQSQWNYMYTGWMYVRLVKGHCLCPLLESWMIRWKVSTEASIASVAKSVMVQSHSLRYTLLLCCCVYMAPPLFINQNDIHSILQSFIPGWTEVSLMTYVRLFAELLICWMASMLCMKQWRHVAPKAKESQPSCLSSTIIYK